MSDQGQDLDAKAGPGRYSVPARFIHWLVAAMVLGLLIVGFYMTGLDYSPFKFKLYGLHKSFGTLVLLFMVARLLWRFITPPPAALPTHAAWEKALAKGVHYVLYAALFIMPLSGWVMSSAAEFSYNFFGLYEMPRIVGKDEDLFRLSRTVHELAALTIMTLVFLHIAGAAKHHLVDKDGTVMRMMPAKGAGAVSLVVIAAGMLSVMTAAFLYVQHEMKETRLGDPVSEQVMSTSVVATDVPVNMDEADTQSAGGDMPVWQIQPDSSEVTFEALVSGESFSGRFAVQPGTVYFDPDRPDQSADKVMVDIASVRTGSDERDEYIVMTDWLDAESFPESAFDVTHFTHRPGQYTAHGALRIKDVSVPLEVPLTIDIDTLPDGQDVAHAYGAFEINRLDFGVGTGVWQDPDTVSHVLTISVSIRAQRQK